MKTSNNSSAAAKFWASFKHRKNTLYVYVVLKC